MRADNTGHLADAARRRRELTRAKAIQAIRELDHAGTPVTFNAVAQAGGVSRSWLYAQDDIRVEIQRLRDATQQAPTSASIPTNQRASNDSLRQRLQAAHDRNRSLAQENARLRRQLAHALGDQRASPRPADLTRSGESNGRDSITNPAK